MICALLITMGFIFNAFTIAAIPLCKSPPMQHTAIEIVQGIGAIVEEIGGKVPKCEIPVLVWVILFDLLIILSAMVPKMTFDQCKKNFEGMKRWDDVAFLASMTVSFKRIVSNVQKIVHNILWNL